FFGLAGLAYGVAIGAVMHMAIQLPFVIKQGMFPILKLKIAFSSVRRVVLLSLPRTITASSNEIAEFFLIAIASTLAFGSVSVFNLSFNLQSVSLSIIGVSYSLAAFPVLTRHFTSGRRAEFIAQMIDSARHIIFWSVPLSILFIVLRAQIVRTILGSGHFNWSDTRLTAAALAIFSVSLVCQNLLLLFVRSYYSRGHTKRPLVINAISAILMVVLGYGLTQFFASHQMFADFVASLLRVSDISGTVALMLPLAFSIGAIVNLVIHWLDFSKEYREFSAPVLIVLYQTFASAVLMGGVAYLLLGVFSRIFDLNTVFGVFLQGFGAGLGGILTYVIILRLLKSRELGEVWRTLHHKIWKTKLVSLEQPELS
ncbi:MAG: lipid II flippase MurJ, partial [Candidatus Paceibacterota bacterium]